MTTYQWRHGEKVDCILRVDDGNVTAVANPHEGNVFRQFSLGGDIADEDWLSPITPDPDLYGDLVMESNADSVVFVDTSLLESIVGSF